VLATYIGAQAVNSAFIGLAVRLGSWCFAICIKRI
jgi:hypothetical protein